MQILRAALLTQLIVGALAVPTTNGITINEDVILFDAPAFADPNNPGSTLASFEAFVFKRQVNAKSTVSKFVAFLALFGVHVGHSVPNLVDRARLFAAKGLGGVTVPVKVNGCSKQTQLSSTDASSHTGIFDHHVSLGSCWPSGMMANAKVALPPSDSRTISSNVFFYPDGGFGVISDVDDTIKITNVLNTRAMLKATFLEDPSPVPGMPELYASLAQNFSPHFFYISGSMLQIHPFLRSFIDNTYSKSNGPLFLRNLTSIPDIVNLLQGNSIFDYKSAIIDQIKGMYPNKKFLAIGDSTQKDPETYGAAFRKHGDFITCAWIRKVDGADNSDARFAAAFRGVPSTRWRLYTDSDIPSLASIKVANGKC